MRARLTFPLAAGAVRLFMETELTDILNIKAIPTKEDNEE